MQIFTLFATLLFSITQIFSSEVKGESMQKTIPSYYVVFDFGGVLTGEPNREAVVQFLKQSLSLSDQEFERLNQLKKEAFASGVTDEEFWRAYALEQEIKLADDWADSLKASMKKAIGINPSMLALVGQLKEKNIPVALFSNIDARKAKIIRDFGYYELFHPCILSCDILMEKPDPKAFEHLIQRLGMPAEQILFIDDKIENVEAAEALGIDALHFQSVENLKEELAQRAMIH